MIRTSRANPKRSGGPARTPGWVGTRPTPIAPLPISVNHGSDQFDVTAHYDDIPIVRYQPGDLDRRSLECAAFPSSMVSWVTRNPKPNEDRQVMGQPGRTQWQSARRLGGRGAACGPRLRVAEFHRYPCQQSSAHDHSGTEFRKQVLSPDCVRRLDRSQRPASVGRWAGSPVRSTLCWRRAWRRSRQEGRVGGGRHLRSHR